MPHSVSKTAACPMYQTVSGKPRRENTRRIYTIPTDRKGGVGALRPARQHRRGMDMASRGGEVRPSVHIRILKANGDRCISGAGCRKEALSPEDLVTYHRSRAERHWGPRRTSTKKGMDCKWIGCFDGCAAPLSRPRSGPPAILRYSTPQGIPLTRARRARRAIAIPVLRDIFSVRVTPKSRA